MVLSFVYLVSNASVIPEPLTAEQIEAFHDAYHSWRSYRSPPPELMV